MIRPLWGDRIGPNRVSVFAMQRVSWHLRLMPQRRTTSMREADSRSPLHEGSGGLTCVQMRNITFSPSDLVAKNGTTRATPWLVQQAVTAVAQKPPPPLADRRARRAELVGYLHVALAVGGLQHDPRPQGQRLGSLGSSYPVPAVCSSDGSGACRVWWFAIAGPSILPANDSTPLIYWSSTYDTLH